MSPSREAGIDTAEIARPLGQQLGWEVLYRTLLDRVAERLHGSRTMLDIVDETQGNWVYDVLVPGSTARSSPMKSTWPV